MKTMKLRRRMMNKQPWIKLGVTEELWQNLKTANPNATDQETEQLATDVKNWWRTFKKHY